MLREEEKQKAKKVTKMSNSQDHRKSRKLSPLPVSGGMEGGREGEKREGEKSLTDCVYIMYRLIYPINNYPWGNKPTVATNHSMGPP